MAQQLYAQEDGVVALNIPARSSLKFNRHFINPTFCFVREQNKYISFNNKREWVQFDNAPQTYLFGYSGRFRENIGAGVSLFQQDYGVLSTFGGVLNFAYNAVLDRDSNLTFGMNLGFYQSGINEGSVVTNFPDSSLDNFPSNSIVTINPGINYGTEFLDFGVSVKNLVSYNFTSSKMIEENPEQSIQGHIMYTGYLNSRGFFDESRFTGLISSEFKKDQTVVSGMIMLMVPKGIWVQGGYNSLYALSAGVGLNVSPQIAVEYNYEKGVGGFSTFGNSHDITLAYKFKNNYRYDYSGDDDEEALLISSKKRNKTIAKRKKPSKPQTRKKVIPTVVENDDIDSKDVELIDEINEEEQTRIAEAVRIKAEEDAQAKLAEEKSKAEKEARIEEIALDEVLIEFRKSANASKNAQQELINKLGEKIAVKQQDLDNLKEENDLSEKGIVSAPKAFKSVSAENVEIESLKLKIDNSIALGNAKISEIETLYKERLKKVKDKDDSVNIAYANTIEKLKTEQLQAKNIKQNLISSLDDIKVATDFERRRRIKRAAYDNEDDRYNKDRAALERIKKFTEPSVEPLTIKDFDHGEELSNIQIVKDVNNVDEGYYLVIAVHNDADKRDEFLKKAVAAGQENINFFFDVNTSKYYIYYDKFDNIGEAKNSLDTNKGNKPYNSKMSMVKIEN